MSINISALQARLRITPDGIAGPKTFAALFARFGCRPSLAEAYGKAADKRLREFHIFDSGMRLAHFMGQCAHESGSFLYSEEIASGQAYEGRKALGNTQRGDGVRFKGRGIIQLTGRANYFEYGKALGLDLISHPELAATPDVAVAVACRFWSIHGLNELADRDDIVAITKRINGGDNGIADRRLQTLRAKALIL